MATVFASGSGSGSGSGSDKSGPSQQKPEPTRPKRPRSSLACIRCRKKKVKCDFVQPTCGRCQIAGLPCSYATPPRRVDGQAFDQLGSHVEELKERMQRMQNELAMMKYNLHPFPGSEGQSSAAGDDDMATQNFNLGAQSLDPMAQNPLAMVEQSQSMPPRLGGGQQQPVTWKLSLSPSGLRIDTNIASVADLYRILLNGISQLNINSDSAISLFSTDAIRGTGRAANDTRTKAGNRSWNRGMRALESDANKANPAPDANGRGNANGRLWEVDDNEARKIIQEARQSENMLPKETMSLLMHNCYQKCFLAYQIVDKEAFMRQFDEESSLDPLLANSISAWVAKHGCIYHQACPDQDPSTMGEAYFKNARQLLKKCFDISSPTTIHALLNLYMYQLSSERSNLAYLYIGLAIRMAQDLKFHKKEHMPADPVQRETNKRLWWSAYWLDLCAALESNRPTMVDDKDCDLDYPAKMDSEDDETGERIEYSVHSIKLMKIRKDITKHLPLEQSGQSLLSAISRLENALTTWLNELPPKLRLEYDDTFQTTGSFRDEACLILNIQYQTTWIMLHKFFLPKQDQTATPVALLSLNICTKAANFVTKMLQMYAKNLSWCQFFYALDGVIASVAIHQINALSNETEVACLAQRNLIVTASVLKQSPLLYMDKINEIIESIEGFLRKEKLPTQLSELPPVNEDSINRQSISSIFHPNEFDSPQQQPQSQPSQTPQQASQTNFGSKPGFGRPSSHSPMMTGTPRQSSVSSPQPQTSMQTPQQNMFINHTDPNLTSPIPMAISPQPPVSRASADTSRSSPQVRPPQHQFNMEGAANTNDMMETSMLFQDPMMGLNIPPGGVSDNSMDQLLMGFDMSSGMQNGERMSSEAFGQQNMFANLGSPFFAEQQQQQPSQQPTPSSQPSHTPQQQQQQPQQQQQQQQQQQTPPQNQQAFTRPMQSNTPFASMPQNMSLFGQQQPSQPSQQQRPNVSSGYPNYMGTPDMFGFEQHTPPQTRAMPQYTQPMMGSQSFDPAALFGQMDPASAAAMSALLVNGGNGGNAGVQQAFGADFMQQQQQQQQNPQQQRQSPSGNPNQPFMVGSTPNDFAAALYAASRKRVHRDWEEPS